MTIGREHEGPPPNQEWRWLVIRPKARACGHPPPGRRSRRLQEIKPQIARLARPGAGCGARRRSRHSFGLTGFGILTWAVRGQVRRDQGGGAGGAGSVPPGRCRGGGRLACAPLFAPVPL